MHSFAPRPPARPSFYSSRRLQAFPLGASLRKLGLTALLGLWAACIPRSESDLTGTGLDGSRPGTYGEDPTLAPIMGGNQNPGEGTGPDAAMAPSMGANPNAISFALASALFAPAGSGNESGPTIYLYAQASTCDDLGAAATAKRGLAVQLQFAGKVAPGAYQVLPGTNDGTMSLAQGQSSASLLNNGTSLLTGATGEVVIGASTATALELESLSLTFAGGQTLALGQVEAQVCQTPSPTSAAASATSFTPAVAFFTQGASGVGPILTLVDQPMTCAALRSASTPLPAGANLLRVYLGDTAFNGTYGLTDTNAAGSTPFGPGRASARIARVKSVATASTGQVALSNYAANSQLIGSLTGSFDDGTNLTGMGFTATYCP